MALKLMKPIVVLREHDENHGGITIDALQTEMIRHDGEDGSRTPRP